MKLQLTLVGAALALGVSAVATQTLGKHVEANATPPTTEIAYATASSGYAKLISDLDDRIDSLQARAADRPDDWLVRMHLANAAFERAGLTSETRDLELVQQVLDEAFAIAPEGSGPVLLAARFDFSIHRLTVAEEWLDRLDRRPLRKTDERLASKLLRAQIAMQRGEYAAALAGLEEVMAANPAAATTELALYHAKTGAPEEADRLLERALAQTSKKNPRLRAWTTMQRGLIALDHGQYLQALERLREADAELPGWWLVQEHMAEAYDGLGEHARALEIYEELVRLYGLPQHLDALASARVHAGDAKGAAELVDRASGLWADALARFPESAVGHGLEHELQHGRPEEAVALAEASHAARPGGDTKVALARAYLAAKRPEDALAVARAALATAYRSAPLHRVASQAYAAIGDEAAAAEQLALCVAFNPSCERQQHSH